MDCQYVIGPTFGGAPLFKKIQNVPYLTEIKAGTAVYSLSCV